MKILSYLALSACLLTGSITVAEDAKTPDTVHGFKVKSLEGKEVDLAKYKGKVLLVVNVASHCGATAQYKNCLLYTSPSPRDQRGSRMPSSA